MNPTALTLTLAPSAQASLHVLTVILVTLLNNLGPLLLAGLVAYALRALHAAIPVLVAFTDRTLGLHLSAAREADLAASVDRAVYAVQGRVSLPADRRDAVVRDITGRFPGTDAAHLDTLINASIAAAKLQHGDEAWRGLAPASPTTAGPDDVSVLIRDAFAAGQQAVLSGFDALRAQAAIAPSAPPVAPTPTALPVGTVASAPVGDDGTGAPVNVAAPAEQLHIVDPTTGHVEGVITPAGVAQATA